MLSAPLLCILFVKVKGYKSHLYERQFFKMIKKRIAAVFLAFITAAAYIALGQGSVVLADDIENNSDFPSHFDLRDEGLVSYVKDQDPWGSCWSFGTSAAAEISILSELQKFQGECGERVAIQWSG